MPMKRERFLEGEDFGTVKEEVKKGVLEFLGKDPNRAYSSLEINSKIHLSIRPPGGIASCMYVLSALDELVEEEKIVCRRIKKKIYYCWRETNCC
jgi:hypothetical protein